MSHYSHQEPPAVWYHPPMTPYPPPVSAPPPMGYPTQYGPAGWYPPPMTPYPPPVSAPPPRGYPTQYGPAGYPQQGIPQETTTTFGGNGFWKGCCAGFYCCSRIYDCVSGCFTADCFTAGF